MVQGDTWSFKQALNVMPIAVAVSADSPTFKTYSSGILWSNACGTIVDHSMIIVGYGDNYWIVKNSWSILWGEMGYVRIGMAGQAGICGIN